jgi:hypothetical protein
MYHPEEGLSNEVWFTPKWEKYPSFKWPRLVCGKDFESVKQFAYKSKQHQEAIKKLNLMYEWYSEELFNLTNQQELGKTKIFCL